MKKYYKDRLSLMGLALFLPACSTTTESLLPPPVSESSRYNSNQSEQLRRDRRERDEKLDLYLEADRKKRNFDLAIKQPEKVGKGRPLFRDETAQKELPVQSSNNSTLFLGSVSVYKGTNEDERQSASFGLAWTTQSAQSLAHGSGFKKQNRKEISLLVDQGRFLNKKDNEGISFQSLGVRAGLSLFHGTKVSVDLISKDEILSAVVSSSKKNEEFILKTGPSVEIQPHGSFCSFRMVSGKSSLYGDLCFSAGGVFGIQDSPFSMKIDQSFSAVYETPFYIFLGAQSYRGAGFIVGGLRINEF
jgi:hypothetical protein